MWAALLISAAGLMGAAGVVMQAAAAHVGGGDLARTAASVLVVHAAVVLAIAVPAASGGRAPPGLLAGASVLALGTVVFASDLALIAFIQARPLPLAAPFGGGGMILGWMGIAVSGIVSVFRADDR